MDVEYSEKTGNLQAENNGDIPETAKNDIDSITHSKEKDSESEKCPDSTNQDGEINELHTPLNSDCALKIKKKNSDQGTCLKSGALSAIAMDYDSSDSEIEEDNEPENSQMKIVTQIVTNFTQNVAKISNERSEVEIISNEKSELEIIRHERPEMEIISQKKPEVEIIDKEISTIEISSEKPEVEVLKEYRSHMEITCSSDEVDSEEDSSSSDDDDDDDDSKSSSKSESSSDSSEEDSNEIKKSGSGKTRQRVRKQSKGEFDDLPPIEDLNINVPEVLCDPLGEVAWIVDQMVVVRPKPGKPTLNLESVLFIERGRRVLGRVFDVFGQVSDPHYCVRFNNSKHIQENNIKVGMNVYFCPNTEYTSVVFLQDLTKMKACDPTDDDEPPQFSDDEEEQAYYQNLRKQQKSEKADSESGIPTKKKRTGQKSNKKKNAVDWKSHHPWNPKRNQGQHQNAGRGQQVSNPQGSYSQNWYGSAPYQQNLWPPFPVFPNSPWSMYYPPNYRGFRPQMGFSSPFQHPPRFSNSMTWNARNQTPPSQNAQPEDSTVVNAIELNPPPPPPFPPPNSSEPGM